MQSFHESFHERFLDITKTMGKWSGNRTRKLAGQITLKFFLKIPWRHEQCRKESVGDILKTWGVTNFYKLQLTSFHDMFSAKTQKKKL